MHWWAQQHKKPWTSTEDNSGGRSENPLHPFYNIQPSEEHSPGDTCVKVYNQEKTSREQIQRVHHKVQIRLFQKTSKKWQTDHFCKRKAGIKINLYQNVGKKQVWRRLGTAHDQSIQHHLWNMGERAWLPVALGYWCLLMTWQRTEAAGWILKSIGIYCLPRFSQMQQSWSDGTL